MRTTIPGTIAAEVMFQHDRTCCICNEPGKQVQIHHIDDDPSNHETSNLAVLCFEDHNKTQLTGGFGRKLGPVEVIKFRDDWVRRVRERREMADKLAIDKNVQWPIRHFETPNDEQQRPSVSQLQIYINTLPATLKETHTQAERLKKDGDSKDHVIANQLIISIMEQMFFQLSAWIDPYHFRLQASRDYASQFIADRNEWNRILVEPKEYGWRARTGTIETLELTIKDIEKSISDLVRALAETYLKQFNFEDWLYQWSRASPYAKRKPRFI